MKSYAAFWLYTLLRIALFAALWVILWLVGVPTLFAGLLAVVLSVPLSLVLLAKPRQVFALAVEERIARRRAKAHGLQTRLDGGEAALTSDAGPPLPPGVSEAPTPARAKRRA